MPADPPADPVPAAVLWDMDGTLVDSEHLWTIALDEIAHDLGGTVGPAARAAITGVDIDTCVAVLIAEVGRPATPELAASLRRRLLDRTAELIAGGVEWRPGAQAALRLVRQWGVPTALVTNSTRLITEIVLDGIGREFFDVTVCGDEVPAGKPAPDPYLRAAALLNVDVADCVAVEDSPNGTLSAERAGAAVLVVPHDVPVPDGPRRTERADLVGLTTAELTAALRGSDRGARVA